MYKALFFLLLLTGLLIESSFIGNIEKITTIHISKDSLPSLEKATDYQNKNVLASNGPITLISGTYNDKYQIDSVNRKGYLYVEINVADLNQNSLKKIPLNISLVIDRSGSMAGDKIEFAKKAAKRIVDRLDSTDYVSIVVYDNFINVIQKATPDTNKKEIKRRIDKIIPRSSTNLWGGTQKGYEEVMSNYRSGFINRVLLISDGQANVGITNPVTIKYKVQQYRDSGISLSTFGVGLDYNELLMTEMAETGAGNYYFIDSFSKMPPLFEKELSSIMSLAARSATLKINLPPGIKISSISDDAVYVQHGNELLIKPGDLFSKETKSYLFRFTIPDKIKTDLKFNTSLNYVNLHNNNIDVITNENLLSPVRDKKIYLKHFNEEVIVQVIVDAISDNIERALLLSDEGNYVSARELLNINDQYLKKYSNLREHSGELKKIEVVNLRYLSDLSNVKKMNADAIKMLQKMNREALYELRNKKQR
ncbi:MAG TPA: VWA domain-containing protein [Flavisolibacter sp.]|nr:VWA domain-containing protein [Flavisolibacter sp.]